MERERSFGRMVWISMLVLFSEAVTVAILVALNGQRETPSAGCSSMGVALLAFLAIPAPSQEPYCR